jgi:glycosyltransferase involved in cell wall biosynthesis
MKTISRVLIASDVWHPQVNGVVRTLDATVRELTRRGVEVRLIEPGLFPGVPCPFYPEFRVCWPWTGRLDRLIADFDPDAIHICTEATIGLAVRRHCLRRRLRYTTSYHTRSADYLERMIWLPSSLGWGYLRWFHGRSARVLVATASLEQELQRRRFRGALGRWSRGVSLDLFHPRPRHRSPGDGPVLLYVGRVSTEKNLEAFLGLAVAGKKYVVGDGPVRRHLEAKYRDAVFLGKLHGEALAAMYSAADVFVFPSKTDTFGLVILEALASGVPVAAYPVAGPADILTDPQAGALDDDLGRAVATALRRGEARACVALARKYTWENCTEQFLGNLVPARTERPALELVTVPVRREVAAALGS